MRDVGQCRGLLAGGEGKRQRVSAALSVVVASFNSLSLSDLCFVVVAGLVEERMVYLGQQHFENKVVVAAAVVKDSTI